VNERETRGSRPLVFVVDDEPLVARALSTMVRQAGCEATVFTTGPDALAALNEVRPQLVMLDLAMPEMDGIEVLRRIRQVAPDLPVVMASGKGTIRAAVDALKLGAFDFLEKPVEQERLETVFAHALERSQLRRSVGVLRAELSERFRMVGNSKALEQVRELIGRVAPTTAGALIIGETGVGKELVARAIHLQSPRQDEPFVALNCAAIPKELIESELFGHVRGAFTGADSARKGKLQAADNGTLFLDEVADMSIAAQAKLLRFLEQPEVERLGSNEPIQLDVRVLAATNKDLVASIKTGSFRNDLFHRLNVVTIRVPALRERQEDIEKLSAFFLERVCRKHNRVLTLAPECLAVLRAHDWPGNVRELRNLIERVAVLARTNPVEPGELESFLDVDTQVRQDGTLKATLDQAEREAVEKALAAVGGSVNAAARKLGVERGSLYRIIKRYGIQQQTSD
jgi:two-component system, NtrC family, nitrogen regulation response regulator NtrX